MGVLFRAVGLVRKPIVVLPEVLLQLPVELLQAAPLDIQERGEPGLVVPGREGNAEVGEAEPGGVPEEPGQLPLLPEMLDQDPQGVPLAPALGVARRALPCGLEPGAERSLEVAAPPQPADTPPEREPFGLTEVTPTAPYKNRAPR